MLRIAICDDDETLCASLEQMLLEYGKQHLLTIETEVFYSGEAMLQPLKRKEQYDIVLLDIELYQINGIEVGAYIRNELNNQKLQIIYVSGKEQYAMQLFPNRPFDFLVKPVTYAQIAACMDQYRSIYDAQPQYYQFMAEKREYKVAASEILYFESIGRMLCVHLTDGERELYGKLDSIAQEAFAADFLRIHKSFLVNPTYVVCYYADEVRMSDGAKLPISRSHQKQVKQYLLP